MNRYLKYLLIAIVFIALLLLLSNRLSNKVTAMLQNDAMAVLELAVAVDQVDIQLGRGLVTISGIRVANVEGFPSDHLFDLSGMQVDIGMLSLLPAALGWRPYRIEEIRVEAPQVTVDIDAQGHSNLQQLADSLDSGERETMANRATQPAETATTGEGAQAAEGTGQRREPTRFTVERLSIENLGFTLNRADKPPETGHLPTIVMEEVGGDQGVTAGGLGVRVSTRISGEILSLVLRDRVSEKLNGRAGALFNRLQGKD